MTALQHVAGSNAATKRPELAWLPPETDWRAKLAGIAAKPDQAWDRAVALANTQLDFLRATALDQMVRRVFGSTPPRNLATKPVRLAVLGSSTLAHLHASIRTAGLRRGIWIETYENDYGQYLQELLDRSSPLHAFKPDFVLFCLDARTVTRGVFAGQGKSEVQAMLDETEQHILHCWQFARTAFQCPIAHQAFLNVMPAVLGSNEHRLPGSRRAFVDRLNLRLRELADAEQVDIVAVDDRAAVDGLDAWHDSALWNRSKQEIKPAAAPMFGDLVGRLLAAKQGRSAKCLVLDLDNTLWGGVIGDDGLDGIVLGQGSPMGEAFTGIQDFARELAQRGIILAVCSKNDEANALEPFEKHPEMVLKRGDIASFRADWSDKPSNIRAIAKELNIGLDAMVFLDDNPFERTLVRQELPMVAVPEVSEDPAHMVRSLVDAGYFEGVSITDEDRTRTAQYQGNRERDRLKENSTDLNSYLAGLEMKLLWRPFDRVGLQRTVQLINKTNQFNLTTRRYTEEDMVALMADGRACGVQLRLQDRFGDNGIIAIVIVRMRGDTDAVIDTWLMSCRVLGRQVEPATLNIIAAQALRLGARRLIGEYFPTAKNGMVRNHYSRLGFTTLEDRPDGSISAALDLSDFSPTPTFIDIQEV